MNGYVFRTEEIYECGEGFKLRQHHCTQLPYGHTGKTIRATVPQLYYNIDRSTISRFNFLLPV
jgi:hypothetical protein